jgi:large subunit ribosomal protein L32
VGTPKKRKSHSRVRMRRNHDALKPLHLTTCSKCGTQRRSHTICGNCGHYRGKQVFDMDEADFE